MPVAPLLLSPLSSLPAHSPYLPLPGRGLAGPTMDHAMAGTLPRYTLSASERTAQAPRWHTPASCTSGTKSEAHAHAATTAATARPANQNFAGKKSLEDGLVLHETC